MRCQASRPRSRLHKIGFLGRHARMSDFLVDAAAFGLGLSYALLKLKAAVIRKCAAQPKRLAPRRKPRAGARFNPHVQVKSLTNDGLGARGIPKSRSLRSCINRGIDAESNKSAVIVGPSYEANCVRGTERGGARSGRPRRHWFNSSACRLNRRGSDSFTSRMLPFYWNAEHLRMG